MVNNNIFLSDVRHIYKNIFDKKFFKNKRLLITGSEGFIGLYLKQVFISYFNELEISKLTCIDKKFKKKIVNKNIEEINFDLINKDLNLLEDKFDIIIHGASIASPVFYRKYPLETCDINVCGIRNILEYAKKNKNVSVLYFSTSEIYGDPDLKNIPTKESYRGNVSCNGPRACYDESKRYAETLCYIYATYYNVSVKVVRPFNNYGPGLKINDGRVPADFAKAVLERKNLIIYSNGKIRRSFCYIADACIGYINMLSLKKYVVLNVGNNKEISIYQFAKHYAKISEKIFNFSPNIIFKKNKDDNYLKDVPIRRCPDTTLAKKTINFKTTFTIDRGIENYLRFLKYGN